MVVNMNQYIVHKIINSCENFKINKKNAMRYIGVKQADCETEKLFDICADELLNIIKFNACFCECDITRENEIIKFANIETGSSALIKNLKGYNKIIVFAATIGIEADRLINRYSLVSPSKALIIDALASSAIESWCDIAEAQIMNGKEHAPRFSPGYGDFPLSLQKNILTLLNTQKNIFLTLNESLMMTPTKSVTAVIGYN